MKLRRADCGHWIGVDIPSLGIAESSHGEQPVYLCIECFERAKNTVVVEEKAPVETKAIESPAKRGPGRPRKNP